MKKSFIFYSSFYDAICDLPDKEQLKVYRAICEYSLKGTTLELKGLSNTVFKLILPILESNNDKYVNGKKGGRPSKKDNEEITNGFENKKPMVFEKEEKIKTSGSENKKPNIIYDNNSDKDKDKEEDKDNDSILNKFNILEKDKDYDEDYDLICNTLNDFNVYGNFGENVQCEYIAKSTKERCQRRSSYNIDGKNYCNQHSRPILTKKIEKENKKSYGEFKRVKLTDREYEKLVADFGKEKIDAQIKLLDEYVESNNNKNKYVNFNLVLRKSIRENWFSRTSNQRPYKTTSEKSDEVLAELREEIRREKEMEK